MMTQEQDLRLKLLNTLLTTPHRDLSNIYPVHKEILRPGSAVLRPACSLV